MNPVSGFILIPSVMKKNLVILLTLFVFPFNIKAAQRFWMGASGSAWNTATNWSGGVVPGVNDTAIFFSSGTVNIDISPSIARLDIAGGADVIFSATADRLITIGNNAIGGFVFLVDVSSTLTLGQGSGVSIQTYGAGVSNTATIGYDAKLILGAGNSQWIMSPFAASPSNCITDIFNRGTVEVASNNTGSVFSGIGTNNLIFSPGSTLNWKRSGGSAPPADFQNGSVINVTGITGTNMTLSNTALYNGLLIWNCTGQTISGSSAHLLPSASSSMDSIRVVSTGTGTLRLATDPLGFTLGHVEVQGGTLELSAPVGNFRVGSISTDLKITGGTVIGNATFTGDVGAHYPMTLTLNGDLTVTGGTFNLTNRPATLNPGGAFLINVAGNVSQTSGVITATTGFGSQNQINMNGTSVQNLELSNYTGTTSLVIANSSGVSLQNHLVLPFYLVLQQGYLLQNNFTTTITYPQIFQLGVMPNPKIVTNGTGFLKITSMPASSSITFPVSPDVSGYNQVLLASLAGASANDYSIRVETGINPSGVYNPNKTINRTWFISPATTISANTVNLSFQYAAADVSSASCNPAAAMELGHFIPGAPGAWSVDPAGSVIPTGTDPYTAGTFAPNSLGSSFVLGNVGSILAVNNSIRLITQMQNNKTLLNWVVDNTAGIKHFIVERSSDGSFFTTVQVLTAAEFSFTDLQPLPHLNYYRIKMLNENGAATYSNTVTILNPASGIEIRRITPNPVVSRIFMLEINTAEKAQLWILISDMQGRQLLQQSASLVSGLNSIPVAVPGLAKGTYLVSIHTVDKKRSMRLVIQ